MTSRAARPEGRVAADIESELRKYSGPLPIASDGHPYMRMPPRELLIAAADYIRDLEEVAKVAKEWDDAEQASWGPYYVTSRAAVHARVETAEVVLRSALSALKAKAMLREGHNWGLSIRVDDCETAEALDSVRHAAMHAPQEER